MTFTLAKQIKTQIALVVFGVVATVIALALTTGRADAACSVDTSRGTVTQTFNVTTAGTYRIWARMGATTTATNDSFYMEIDGGECINIGDTAVPTSGWKWVDYRDGNTATKANTANLTAGSHTVKYIGKEDAVKLDKVLFLSGDACTPTDAAGNPCVTVADTTAPTSTLTAPTANQVMVGTVNLTANATDNVAVQQVQFYLNGTALVPADNASPYSYSLNTLQYANGTYTIYAKATDTSTNTTNSSTVTVTINNPVPDNTDPTVSISSPANNATLPEGSVTVNATATDNVGVAKVEFLLDNVLVSTDTSAPYSGSLNLVAGTHTITAKAYDTSNRQATSTINVTVNGTTPTPKTCDWNNDSKVTLLDLGILISNYGKTVTANSNGDCNNDGRVTLLDLGVLISVYGK